MYRNLCPFGTAYGTPRITYVWAIIRVAQSAAVKILGCVDVLAMIQSHTVWIHIRFFLELDSYVLYEGDVLSPFTSTSHTWLHHLGQDTRPVTRVPIGLKSKQWLKKGAVYFGNRHSFPSPMVTGPVGHITC